MTSDSNHSMPEKTTAQIDRLAELQQRLAGLTSRNPHVRAESAKRLGELNTGTEALLHAMNDTSSLVRAAAANALGNSALGAEDAYLDQVSDTLLAAIDDPSDFVCSAAINAMGRLHIENGREQILACLQDNNPHIVEAAIIALGRLGPPEIAENLVVFLESTNVWVQTAAVRAIGMLNYTSANERLVSILEKSLGKPFEARHIQLQNALIQTLAKLKVEAAIPLLVHIAQNEVGLRSRAVQALIDMKAIEIVPSLIKMFTDPGNSLRCSLIQMVVQANYRQALPIIRPLLSDKNVKVRQTALEAVVAMNDLSSLKLVREIAFHDSGPFLRARAVNALVRLAGMDCMDDLVALAGDSNALVREAVTHNLGLFKPLPQRGHRILVELAGADPSPLVIETAREILREREVPAEIPEKKPNRNREQLTDHQNSFFPETLLPEAAHLLKLLEQWQMSLGNYLNQSNADEIAELDTALAKLIKVLIKKTKP